MSDIILKAEHISKQYRLGLVGSGSLKDDLNRWWHLVRGKEDPFLKVGTANDRSVRANDDYVWALQDINFEVKRGEVLGIIGKNGAGKSTLLKILSRVTSPTTGSIKTRGRIASLLEVGTGFHPELTGKENIFLNGAILGMNKAEIASKLDEIIDFSGCEGYIDTPVKRYSSGMRVRLAFAVAAHLEPEILVIDEVLAVGDAEFQKKAIGKMQDISKEGGRTILFVSHNMAAVKSLCTRGILLKNGGIYSTGEIEDVVQDYLSASDSDKKSDDNSNGLFTYTDVDLIDSKGKVVSALISGEDAKIRIYYKSEIDIKAREFFWGFSLNDAYGNLISGLSSIESGIILDTIYRKGYFDWSLSKLALRGGIYSLKVFSSMGSTSPSDFLHVNEKFSMINILPGDYWKTGKINRSGQEVILDCRIDNVPIET